MFILQEDRVYKRDRHDTARVRMLDKVKGLFVMSENNNSTYEIEEYCPLCVGYFEDIKQHNYDKHDRKLIDFGGGKHTYDLPFLKRLSDIIAWETQSENGTP